MGNSIRGCKKEIIENQTKTNTIGRKYWDAKKHEWRAQPAQEKGQFKTIDQSEIIPRLADAKKRD